MYKGKSFLAIIPARAGSKRLPKKNILDFSGKPLVSWVIESSIGSQFICDTIISSNDQKILEIGKKYGIQTITRPIELASDTSSTIDAILHVLENILDIPDYIVLLQATSPLRKTNHINEAIELLIAKNADAIVSVCETEHSPLWTNTLESNLDMKNFIHKDIKNKRSQDLPIFYRLNGAIYICDVKKLLKEKTLFLKENIYAYKMNKKCSIDIDDEIDFKLAELLFD